MMTTMLPLFLLGLLTLLIFVGVHIGIALLGVSVFGIWIITGNFSAAMSLLKTGPFHATYDYTFAVIPIFILMGLFANESGASADLYKAAFAWFGRLPGGLGVVTAISNAVFAAVTGVSIASAAVFSKIAIPEMLRFGYNKRFSTGCVAGTAALGMLIPPSIMFIVYGILSTQSIGKLFIAGIIPGIVLTILFCLVVMAMAIFAPKMIGNPSRPERASWSFRFRALADSSAIFGLIALTLGGMYAGIFTPTEAGAVGCVGCLAIMIFKRKFNVKSLQATLVEAGFTTASVFLVIIGSQLFGRMLAISGLVEQFSLFVTGLRVHPLLILTGILIVFMILGCFLDVVSILVISMPIILPVIEKLGFDLIWFGVIATVSIETGLVTPPFGMTVFVVKGSMGDTITLEDIYIGAFPFLLMIWLTIAILMVFPSLATWLPSLM